MVERQATSRLNREFILLQQASTPQFCARPSEGDTLTWHYVLYDLPRESPYYGGQYHGKLVFPREYPLKPPSIMMCTPSGRFEVNKRLCLSMSDYHPETWNPSWRVETILLGLVSFMLDESDPTTAGGIRASFGLRHSEAHLSFFRNRRNKEFCTLFPELIGVQNYIPGVGFRRDISAVPSEVLKRDRFSEEDAVRVQTFDDLNSVLKARGVSTDSQDHPNTEKTLMNTVFPWLAIGAVFSAWAYSQIRSV